MLLHCVSQRGFEDVLHDRVNRQHCIQAVARLHVFVTQRSQFAMLSIRFGHAPTRDATQRGIQNQLDTIATGRLRNLPSVYLHFIRPHKTEDVRRE
jgi:hypothetical protein